ncbi:MAG TPA: c-type cytochrome [Longimicrobiales bacterium]|nr:c-type cytochrome [Longimicrobiales bacterium]
MRSHPLPFRSAATGIAVAGVALGVAVGLAAELAAQDIVVPAEYRGASGEELYQVACAACHGADGTGAPPSTLGFEEPMPDFTMCSFATREPDSDWVAVAHQGGPVRGFSPMMPAFGGLLDPDQLQRVQDHIRTFCGDGSWPRGELNFPRAMFTEKAYPEDEAVWTVDVSPGDDTFIMNEIVYENRFGSRSQFEVVVPFGARELTGNGSGGWQGGLGDVVLGVKHTLLHSSEAGSILSLAGEVKLPTGREEEGFGGGTTVFETFLAYGQALPADGFLHAQGILEFPTGAGRANELLARAALGRTFTEGPWGRAWSPMIEVLSSRSLEDGGTWAWDIAPQFHVTVNTRQHVMANVAVLLPLTDRDTRDPRILFFVLWDWFDGGFLEGW